MNVAIAIPPNAALARALLERGRRFASLLGARWTAVLVWTSDRQRHASADLDQLVSALGGELHAASARDVASALIDLSERECADVLFIGASRRPAILRRLSSGTTEKLLRATTSFDLAISPLGAGR